MITETSRDLALEACKSARATGEALERILSDEATSQDWEGFTGDPTPSDVVEVLDGVILEGYAEVRRYGLPDMPDQVTAVTIVIGLGGPDQRLTIRADGGTDVVACWGGDVVELSAYLPTLAQHVWTYWGGEQ